MEKNKQKANWTYGEIRFYGAVMAILGFSLGMFLSFL